MNLQENIQRIKEVMGLITEGEKTSEIKNSKVDYVFDNHPELSDIGTKEQYTQYLASIFPDSKIKDIMFHASPNKFSQFKDPSSSGLSHIWFSEEPLDDQFGSNVYSVILDIKNPLSEENPNYRKEISRYESPLNPDWINNYGTTGELPKFEYDGTVRGSKVDSGKSVTVRSPNQIHILGSEQDMKQFKNFINKEMNLQENIQRIKEVMGLLTEEIKRNYESKPIILIGPQGTGKSTTAKALAKKLGIPLIETDMLMVDPKFEESCKDEPGVEVNISRNSNGGINYNSNKHYEFCVMKKIFEKYGDQKVVLDVGGTHARWEDNFSSHIMKLFESTPNIFLFNVTDDEDETYEFLKKRREGRGEKISPEKEERFRKIISDLNNFYRGLQKISIINSDKSSKTTDEMVDEIITKLT